MNSIPDSTRASDHLRELAAVLAALSGEAGRIEAWGRRLGERLRDGGRLLVAGNGGSAAQAQHLSAELVGRYLTERTPLSAIALHADSSSFTAICNDYGADEVFARQIEAHGRAGDVVLLLSTSGRSSNLLAAAERARRRGLLTWALTGCEPNPLARACHDALCIPASSTAVVQEIHQVCVHLLCEAVDAVVCADAGHTIDLRDGVRAAAVAR